MLGLGAVVVALGFFVAWKILNEPDYGEGVGPGIGFFGFLVGLAAAALGLVLGLIWLAFFRPGPRALSKFAGVCAAYLVVIGVLSWAPWIPPRTYLSLEIVGLVASSDYTSDGVYRVTLEGGRTLAVDGEAQQNGRVTRAGRYAPLPEGPVGIRAGDLLLAGEHPTPWYTAADGPFRTWSTDPPSLCYGLKGRGFERQDSVDMETGLRLTKAADYPNDGPFGYGFQGQVCLNLQGEVVAIQGAY